MRWLASLTMTLAVLASFWTKDARACSCLPDRILSPEPNATNVPLNAQLTIWVLAPSSAEPHYRLERASDGRAVEVVLTRITHGQELILRLRPVQPLEPSTRYRLSSATDMVQFETGIQADIQAPSLTGPTDFQLEVFPGEEASCGPGYYLRFLDGSASDDATPAEGLRYELYTAGSVETLDYSKPSFVLPAMSVPDNLCTPGRVGPTPRFAVSWIAVDRAGNRSLPSTPVFIDAPVPVIYPDPSNTVPTETPSPQSDRPADAKMPSAPERSGCSATGSLASLPFALLVLGLRRRRAVAVR